VRVHLLQVTVVSYTPKLRPRKTCNYCKKSRGWLGKEHEEKDCWTKQREEKKGRSEANKTEKGTDQA
jgi:hypothetical protein